MLRNVDLSEISDGKLYDANDMVKADCKAAMDVPPAAGAWVSLSSSIRWMFTVLPQGLVFRLKHFYPSI
mgnify:CR=1 FL=1